MLMGLSEVYVVQMNGTGVTVASNLSANSRYEPGKNCHVAGI